MKHIFKKYEFTDEATAKAAIAALPHIEDEEGNLNPSHNHTVVELGYLWTEQPTYDENGDVLTAGTQSDKYSVDVLWNKSQIEIEVTPAVYEDQDGIETMVSPAVMEVSYPDGWEECEIQYDETWSNQNGAHTFAGWSFN